MRYENSKSHTTLLCPITPLTANLDPITHHADKLGPITCHRKPLYHPCEKSGSSRYANQLLHFFVNFFLMNFLSLHKSWEKIKNWPLVDASKDFEIPETG